MKDKKIWFETEQGQKLFIYQVEDCDMQKELTETISVLQNKLQQKDNAIDECIELMKQTTLKTDSKGRSYAYSLGSTKTGMIVLEKLQHVKGYSNE